jgi:hypothetical protein
VKLVEVLVLEGLDMVTETGVMTPGLFPGVEEAVQVPLVLGLLLLLGAVEED